VGHVVSKAEEEELAPRPLDETDRFLRIAARQRLLFDRLFDHIPHAHEDGWFHVVAVGNAAVIVEAMIDRQAPQETTSRNHRHFAAGDRNNPRFAAELGRDSDEFLN